ncbi:hypothetical protein DFJ43DRAFT_1098161 [Lentinula guzmanii]|uniref:Uncharacterized protein n=1 Tax=Lentinula guzmanii TaxID=2804957 RepID=A0AA38MVV5_9AGAR|nr:hypothetical protein DFJ43DRAFT_1228587 [Lentinula guzmanii]KAJ3718578.1 hypothetical protein DFJ43DRAFT_1098161 [Lentinula guzmanii]
MHRSWHLLSLAFIALISVSSVCTFPVELHSGGSPRNDTSTSPPVPSHGTATIRWLEPATKYVLELRQAREMIPELVKQSADVLGLDDSPNNPLKVVYDPKGPSFGNAYRFGWVKFKISGGRETEGKEVVGIIYVGDDDSTSEKWGLGKISFDQKTVFPKNHE